MKAAKFLMLCASVIISAAVYAQPQQHKGDWKEKVKAERIAFITTALELSPKEAQVFWPVYNEIGQSRQDLHRKVRESYRMLETAVREGRGEEEALNKYIQALEAQQGTEGKNTEKLKSVLPAAKVAKLYLAEEQFRRQQIHRLHHPKQ